MDTPDAEGGTSPRSAGPGSGIDGSEWASMPTRGRGGEDVMAMSSSTYAADVETRIIAHIMKRTMAVSIICSHPLCAPGLVATS